MMDDGWRTFDVVRARQSFQGPHVILLDSPPEGVMTVDDADEGLGSDIRNESKRAKMENAKLRRRYARLRMKFASCGEDPRGVSMDSHFSSDLERVPLLDFPAHPRCRPFTIDLVHLQAQWEDSFFPISCTLRHWSSWTGNVVALSLPLRKATGARGCLELLLS